MTSASSAREGLDLPFTAYGCRTVRGGAVHRPELLGRAVQQAGDPRIGIGRPRRDAVTGRDRVQDALQFVDDITA